MRRARCAAVAGSWSCSARGLDCTSWCRPISITPAPRRSSRPRWAAQGGASVRASLVPGLVCDGASASAYGCGVRCRPERSALGGQLVRMATWLPQTRRAGSATGRTEAPLACPSRWRTVRCLVLDCAIQRGAWHLRRRPGTAPTWCPARHHRAKAPCACFGSCGGQGRQGRGQRSGDLGAGRAAFGAGTWRKAILTRHGERLQSAIQPGRTSPAMEEAAYPRVERLGLRRQWPCLQLALQVELRKEVRGLPQERRGVVRLAVGAIAFGHGVPTARQRDPHRRGMGTVRMGQ